MGGRSRRRLFFGYQQGSRGGARFVRSSAARYRADSQPSGGELSAGENIRI